jgi:hypothetical protein
LALDPEDEYEFKPSFTAEQIESKKIGFFLVLSTIGLIIYNNIIKLLLLILLPFNLIISKNFKSRTIAECSIINYSNGRYSISVKDNINMKPLDRVHLFFSCFTKVLFDLGDFEPIVLEIINKIRFSILSSKSNNSFQGIDVMSLLKFIENYHRLDFNISAHLGIVDFGQIERTITRKSVFSSKFQIINPLKTNKSIWSSNSYYPFDFSKVYIPINIALLFNYIFKEVVYNDKFDQTIFERIYEEFVSFTSGSNYFYDISRLQKTQGFISGQIHSERESILLHKSGN